MLQLCSHSTASLSILLFFVSFHCFKEYIKSILVTSAHQESSASAGQVSGGQIGNRHPWLAIPLSALSSWCFKTGNNSGKNCSGKASCSLNCPGKCYIKQGHSSVQPSCSLDPPVLPLKANLCFWMSKGSAV